MGNMGSTPLAFVFALAAGSSLAADLPVNKSAVLSDAPAAAAPFSWTGFFAGANAGYNFGQAQNNFVLHSAFLATFVPDAIVNVQNAGSQMAKFRTGAIGLEAGYNYQVSDLLVVGAVANADFRRMRAKVDFAGFLPVDAGGLAETLNQKLSANWTDSLQLRLGVVPMERTLLFVSAGVAAARMVYSSAYNNTANEREYVRADRVRPGWVIGGGVEYALAQNWSAKLEYNHATFMPINFSGTALLTDGSTAHIDHTSGFLRMDTVRFGINYLIK